MTLSFHFSKGRPGMIILIKEFERKISAFYGTDMELVALAMDSWLCPGYRELDNVVFFLEPTVKTSETTSEQF